MTPISWRGVLPGEAYPDSVVVRAFGRATSETLSLANLVLMATAKARR
jgi:hypothetical protein